MAKEEANSGTATGGDYDVFLSFRGPDTRNTFTDCLYVFMRKAGICIFRDDEELRPGEKISEILRAVENSHIYIPIFSKNYASSRWCLRELTRMVESYGQSPEKQILPIFYDVDPSDVKLETELYRSALTKHEEDLGCTEVKPWKEALTMVARIKGWHMKDQRQGEVIDDVIKKVSRMIIIRKRDLPTYLVGIDDRIEDIEKLLNHGDTGDVRFVIIHGMGGIGKTTLAKAIFNELFSGFEGHSFLSNISESSPCHGIVKMQRKLLADLFNFLLPETFDFEDVNNMIRNRLPNKRVLLVFDGMDENDQFMQLAKHCTSCGPGSRIIITTRDKCVFPKIKVEGLEENILTGYRKFFLYEMKEMHFDHALQLFKKLAINTDSALFDLYDLSREVVALTGGLPLAIEVIGSHLRNISKAKWKSTLKKLKEIPLEEVQRKLKISYNALGHETKQIFLDIACFFVNKKITDAMYMWEACDLFPEVEIDVLINKSLIKIVDRDRIWIHDQLRDLGREIVRQESIGKPGDRSRLWFLEMALNIVQAKKGTKNVVALTLWRSRHNFTREDFANLMNARFLELDGGNFIGNFEDILPELRWLCWQNCPPKLQANNFVLNHLVVLKLSGNLFIEEWSGWVEMMVPSKLKVLHLMGSKSLIKTPPFYELISLERLILKDFPKLAEIDPSVGKLEQLIYLKIKWCPHLGGLPEEIGCLTALRELILVHCFSVCYLPESICYLKHLSRLVMEDTRLVKLPVAIEKLVALEYMSLVNCTSLNGLPDAVGKLGCLTELDLSGTTIKELPYSIWNREDLTVRTNSCNIRTPRRLEDKERVVPLNTYVLISNFRLAYNLLRRPDGTFHRDLAEFLDWKVPANSIPVYGVLSFDHDDHPAGLLNRVYLPAPDDASHWGFEELEKPLSTTEAVPVILFFHGGSFCHSSANSAIYDTFCRRLVGLCKGAVVSVNYRRSPKHRYPCANDDGWAALKWVKSRTWLMSGKDSKVHVYLAGDSSGGNIAHHMAVRAAEAEVEILGNLLLHPLFGGQERTESEKRLDGKYFVGAEERDWYWRAYLPEGEDRDHPACNPFGPRGKSLEGLKFPKSLVVVAGLDILQDWQMAYVEGLKRNGQEVKLLYLKQATIGFYFLPNNEHFYCLMEEIKDFVRPNC